MTQASQEQVDIAVIKTDLKYIKKAIDDVKIQMVHADEKREAFHEAIEKRVSAV